MPNIGKNSVSDKDGNASSKTMLAGMPPSSDDSTMQFLLDKISAMDTKITRTAHRHMDEMRAMRAEIDEQKSKINKQEETIKNLSLEFKGRYVSEGGDTCFYSNLGVLKERLRAACGDDQEVLEKFDQWEKERNFKGNVRVGLTMLGGAVAGAAIGGAVAGALHCGIIVGAGVAAAAVGIAAVPATIIVLGCAAGGLLIAIVGWGIYKLYQRHQLKKAKADDLTQEENQMLQNFNINELSGLAANAQ